MLILLTRKICVKSMSPLCNRLVTLDRSYEILTLRASFYNDLDFHVCIPEFLKTGLAKIRAHSTTWQLKAKKFVQRPKKKPISWS